VSQQSDTKVAIANSLYFCAFEKADEALLNDYEEMIAQVRTNKEGVVTLFQSMIEGVIAGNPVSIDAAIEKQWSELAVDLRACQIHRFRSMRSSRRFSRPFDTMRGASSL